MPPDEEWNVLIEEQSESLQEPLSAIHVWNAVKQGISNSVQVEADDDNTYLVKGIRSDRDLNDTLCAEQIVGYLGNEMGAPVPSVKLMELPEDLVNNSSTLQNQSIEPGLAHACEWVENLTNKISLINS